MSVPPEIKCNLMKITAHMLLKMSNCYWTIMEKPSIVMREDWRNTQLAVCFFHLLSFLSTEAACHRFGILLVCFLWILPPVKRNRGGSGDVLKAWSTFSAFMVPWGLIWIQAAEAERRISTGEPDLWPKGLGFPWLSGIWSTSLNATPTTHTCTGEYNTDVSFKWDFCLWWEIT